MPLLHRIRQRAGALVYDWPAFERRLRAPSVAGRADPWLEIRNRDERITSDERGVRCGWRFTSDLHIANVFPTMGARLMRRALDRWPITMRDALQSDGDPAVSFIIGHRGAERLPHLLATVRSIAAQSDVAVECIVVEQSSAREIESRLPAWVRYVHTPLPRPDLPYCRSWAFNVGANHSRGRVLICHDNDMLVPESYAFEALGRVSEGWKFADLKRFLFYLSPEDTTFVFENAEFHGAMPRPVVQNARGGSIVAERAAFLAIGGFDESFVGWGGEDNDFWDRAETTKRVYTFGYLPMIHLSHPFQAGKWDDANPAVARYRALETFDPRERIARLLERKQGRVDRPATD